MADGKELYLGIAFTGRVTKQMETSINKIRTALASLNGTLNVSTAQANKTGKALEGVGSRINKATPAVTKFASAWTRVKSAMMTSASFAVAGSAIYAVTRSLRAGLEAIVDYDQALYNLQAITGASDAQIRAMGSTMLDVARATKFSSTEVAEGMVLLGQAGLSAEEAINAISSVASLATGTLSSMALTADLMTTTIRAFNIDASQSSRIADVMANAINKSKLTVDKLRVAFNFVGAAAAQTGLSLEETAASMMVMANAGIRASTIGTGMRQVLARLLAPSRKLREAFEEHGIELDRVNPKIVGFQTAMKNLLPAIYDHEKGAIDMAKAYELFGLRGAQAAAILGKAFMLEGAGSFKTALTFAHRLGTALEMQGKQAEGLGVKLKNLADRLKNVAIAFGGSSGLVSVLKGAIDVMAKLSHIIEVLLKTGLSSLLIQITAVALALKGLLVILTLLNVKFLHLSGTAIVAFIASLGKLTISIGALKTAFIKLFLVMGKNWFFLITAGVAALLIYMNKLRNVQQAQIEKLQENIVESKRALSTYQALVGVLESLKNKYGDTVEKQDEYINFILRMIKEHPEVVKGIDAMTASIGDYEKALKRLGSGEAEKAIKDSLLLLEKLITKEREFADASNLRQHSETETEYNERLKERNRLRQENLNLISEEQKSTFDMIYEELKLAGLGEDSAARNIKWRQYSLKLSDEEKQAMLEAYMAYHRNRAALEALMKAEQKRLADLSKAGKVAKENVASERAYYALLESLMTDDREKAKVHYEKKKEEIKKNHAERLALAKKQKLDLDEVDTRTNVLNLANEEQYKVKLLEIELKHQEKMLEVRTLMQRILLEQRKRDAIGDEKTTSELNKKLLELDAKQLEDILALKKAFHEKVKKETGAGSKYTLEAFKEELKAAKTHEEALTAIKKYGIKARVKEEKKGLREQLEWADRSSEEYKVLLREALEVNLITQREYNDKMIEADGTFWERMNLGFEQSKKAAKTWGEFIVDVGKNLNEKLADGMTDALWDMIEGTKTAGQAFQEFAMDTLKWLSQMILRQQIYNALMAMGSIGGGATGNYAGPKPGYHGGGIIGRDRPSLVKVVNPHAFINAPKMHGGGMVGKDEVPIIAKKGEGVFTEEQMAAMGGRNEVTIANFTDPSMMDNWMHSARGRNALVNFIGRNKGEIRRMIR